jgi:hypothetical protein
MAENELDAIRDRYEYRKQSEKVKAALSASGYNKFISAER